MAERRRYRNPPVEEALCEFRFDPSQEWDLTIPGKLQAALGDAYTGKPRHQMGMQALFQAQSGGATNLTFSQGLARVQLIDRSGKRIVAVGQDVLSIHMLRPYQDPAEQDKGGWDEFRRRIEQALHAYWKVAKPLGVRRVGVRYVNRIVVPSESCDPQRYILCAPRETTGLPVHMNRFVVRVESRYEDGVRLVVTCATLEDSPEPGAFLLDIDVIWETESAVGKPEAMAKTEDLRDRERQGFEALITDEARRLFDEV